MNNSKNSFRKNQLNSNSTLFLQLGIILALIIVYSFFELKFSKKVIQLPEQFSYTDESTFPVPDFIIEKKIPKNKPKKRKPIDLTQIIIDESIAANPDINNVLIDDSQPIDTDSSLSKIIEVIPEDDDEPMPISIIEQAPRYPGCKEKTEIEYRKCLSNKIMKFVSKKFSSDIATEMNIHGKLKIHVQFEIDKNGDIINIKAKSPHKKLEKEAVRVVGKLPKMTPGKQHDRNVGVKYNLPISFFIK